MFRVDILPGGIDISTENVVNIKLSKIISKEKVLETFESREINMINPITTIQFKLTEDKINSSITRGYALLNIDNLITSSNIVLNNTIGVNVNDVDKDYISGRDEEMLKTSVKISQMVDILNKATSADNEKIIESISESLQSKSEESGSTTFDFKNSQDQDL